MAAKAARVAALLEGTAGDARFDRRYLAFFDLFNRGAYFEAHDALEDLWLAGGRLHPHHRLFKGLIQLAGAFVHLQKERLRPADALFGLAASNLSEYPGRCEGIDLAAIGALINAWRAQLAAGGFDRNPLTAGGAPQLATPSFDHS